MTNDFNKLNKVLDPSLSEAERAKMRGDFLAFMAAHPVASRIPSPYFVLHAGAAYAFAVFLLVSAPVLYAAEHSLPNDPLYSLKTKFLEPAFVGAASLSSDSAEADVNVSLVNRRLREAEQLSATDELSPEIAEDLKATLTASIEKVRAHVAQSRAEGDLEEALDAGLDLENALEAHGRVLDSFADDSAAPTDDTFADEVQDLGQHAQDTNDDTEEQLESDSNPDAAYVAEVSQEAKDAIATAEAQLVESGETSLTAEAEELLGKAKEAYAASSSQASGDDAVALMRDALQYATQVSIILLSDAASAEN